MAKRHYTNKTCAKFVKNLEEAGYVTRHYHGRFFYEGPAVTCKIHELDQIKKIAKVAVQRDSLGLGLIVYPVARDRGEEFSPEGGTNGQTS